MADATQTLAELRGTGDWRAIPSILSVLSHDNDVIRRAAASVVAELAAMVPSAALPGFEARLRESTLQAYNWNELGAGWINERDWPRGAWAVFTMHPSGFVREAAVRRLLAGRVDAASLQYLLLRVNDWVAQVRTTAAEGVRACVTPDRAGAWLPALGLVDQLRKRSRADHSWLAEAVAALFLRPECRPELTEAARSADRGVARWAFSTALRLPPGDRGPFVRLALENPDAVVRLRAAALIRTWKECPGRGALLGCMGADRFAPIRREALYAVLDAPAAVRRDALRSALLDPHASVRHAARFYLREGGAFDARAFYAEAIASAPNGPSAAAVAGLGECGTADDAGTLRPLAADARSSVAAAAVRAVAAVARADHVGWFEGLLTSDRASVAKEAAKALTSCSGAASVAALRAVLRDAPLAHSRRCALRVLLRRHPYDAVVDAVNAAHDPDPTVVRYASDFIERTAPWRVRFGPTADQVAAAASTLRNAAAPLPATLEERVREFMGIPGGPGRRR